MPRSYVHESDTTSTSTAPSDEEPRVLFYAKALVDYTPDGTLDGLDVVSFRVGDTIGVTNWDDDVWWFGCTVNALLEPSSVVGTFPAKYEGGEPLVERFSSQDLSSENLSLESDEDSVDMSHRQQHVDDSPRHVQRRAEPQPAPRVLLYAKALLDYDPPKSA